MDEWEDIELDSDVPIPSDTRNTMRYPWPKFKVNNSLFFSPDNGEDNAKRLKNRLDQSTRTFAAKQTPPWKFVLRVRLEKDKNGKDQSGVRVWRVS
jgi:hypothetical protein